LRTAFGNIVAETGHLLNAPTVSALVGPDEEPAFNIADEPLFEQT
jgi:hypothetical protein